MILNKTFTTVEELKNVDNIIIAIGGGTNGCDCVLVGYCEKTAQICKAVCDGYFTVNSIY